MSFCLSDIIITSYIKFKDLMIKTIRVWPLTLIIYVLSSAIFFISDIDTFNLSNLISCTYVFIYTILRHWDVNIMSPEWAGFYSKFLFNLYCLYSDIFLWKKSLHTPVNLRMTKKGETTISKALHMELIKDPVTRIYVHEFN